MKLVVNVIIYLCGIKKQQQKTNMLFRFFAMTGYEISDKEWLMFFLKSYDRVTWETAKAKTNTDTEENARKDTDNTMNLLCFLHSYSLTVFLR